MDNFNPRKKMLEIFNIYNHSNEWQRVRKQVKERDKNTCVDCKKYVENGISHHTKYDNWGKGNFEEVKDCVYLCIPCHIKKHVKMLIPFWARQNMKIESYSKKFTRKEAKKEEAIKIREAYERNEQEPNKVALTAIQKQVGHKRLATTQIYSDFAPEQVREAYERQI